MAPIHYATRTYANYANEDPTAAAVVGLVEQVLVHDVACTRKVVLDDCMLIAVGIGLGMLTLSMIQDVMDKYRSREEKPAMVLLSVESPKLRE